jgi:hypothetical protein
MLQNMVTILERSAPAFPGARTAGTMAILFWRWAFQGIVVCPEIFLLIPGAGLTGQEKKLLVKLFS